MTRLQILFLCGAMTLAPANADFTLRPDETNASETDSAQPTAVPHTDPSNGKSQPSSLLPVQKPIPRRTTPVARGFGDQIPLSFAVRQIVPPAIKLRFGRGTDPSALVDWKGGREWPSVLREAIRPLKLRLAVHPGAATIYDPKNQ